MSQAQWHNELRIPAALALKLGEFRRRVWTIKLVEAIAVAAISVLVAFLSVFALDRLFDTPAWLRALVGIGAAIGCCAVPWFLHRWVWRFRRLDQLARLLSRKMPRHRRSTAGHHRTVREPSGAESLARSLPGSHRASIRRRPASRLSRGNSRFAIALGAHVRGHADIHRGASSRIGSRRGQQRVGTPVATLGRYATVHVRRARTAAERTRCRPRRAVPPDGQARDGFRLETGNRDRAPRQPATDDGRTGRRRLLVRLSRADRSRHVAHARGRCHLPRQCRTQAAPRADDDRRQSAVARIPGPARCARTRCPRRRRGARQRQPRHIRSDRKSNAANGPIKRQGMPADRRFVRDAGTAGQRRAANRSALARRIRPLRQRAVQDRSHRPRR